MTVSNGSYETQAIGGPIGAADKWTPTEVFTAEEYAEFADNPGGPDTSGQESFEVGWFPPFAQTFVADLSGGLFVDIQPAFFDGGTQVDEDFENLWGDVILLAPGLQDAQFLPDLGDEDFEKAWDAPTDLFIPFFGIFGVPNSGLTFATFDGAPESFEDFEEEWGTIITSLPAPTLSFFTIGPASLFQYESFEAVRLDLDNVTVTPGTDRVNRTAHLLVLAYPITFRNESGRLPDGILPATQYLVFNETANDLQIRDVPGGTAVDILDNGFGSHFIRHDPASWWIDEVEGV